MYREIDGISIHACTLFSGVPLCICLKKFLYCQIYIPFMPSNPNASPNQKIALRLLACLLCATFGFTQMRTHDVHGIPAGPDIQGGLFFVGIAIVAALICLLIYRSETKKIK